MADASIAATSTAACSAYPVPPPGPIITVSRCASDRDPAARTPREFTTARVSTSVLNDP